MVESTTPGPRHRSPGHGPRLFESDGIVVGDGEQVRAASRQSAQRLNELRRRWNAALREDADAAWPEMLRVVLDQFPASSIFHFQAIDSGPLHLHRQLGRHGFHIDEPQIDRLRDVAAVACRDDQIKVASLDDAIHPTAYLVPAACNAADRSIDCLAIVVPHRSPTDEQVAVLNFLGAYLSIHRLTRRSLQSEVEADHAAALAELIGRLPAGAELAEIVRQLADDLQRHLGCARVVIGLNWSHRSGCRTVGISHGDGFSTSAELTRRLDAALQEVVLRRQTVMLTEANGEPPPPALRRVMTAFGAQVVVAGCLRNAASDTVGAWIFLGDAGLVRRTWLVPAIESASEPIGNLLDLLRESQPGRFRRAARRWWHGRHRWQSKVAALLPLVLLGVLLLPWRYSVKCEFTLRPVQRRFLAAPFDGVLQQALARTGDLVAADQLLGELDGREIRVELAALAAERERAAKQRQVALATHDPAAARQAQLDLERIELRIELLTGRQSQLQLRSPIHGVILRGDLENAIGAPVTIGQSLFEVAPLDDLVAELSIPDEEIHQVNRGATVWLRTDAAPGEYRQVSLEQIHPSAEIRDQNNIFVGRCRLENASRQLRPGMKGWAKIDAGRHSLAWILFHKPWNRLLRW